MAISDTITSMQTHTSNAYTMIGYGTDLTGINKNLENLSSTIFNAFLEALRTPDTLFTNLPKKSGTGANITLNDTANAPMRIELGARELTQAGTPTPSSPQDIHTISGSNKVVVNGKNLVNINGTIVKRESASYSNIVRTRNSLSYNITSTIAGYLGFVIPINIGQQYTLSYNISKGSIYMIELDSLITEVGTNYGVYRPNGYSFTATKSYVGIWLVANTDGGSQASVSNLMLEKGSSSTEYEPYTSQEADIDLGVENLVRLTNYINSAICYAYNQNGISFMELGNGYFKLKGTATAQANFTIYNPTYAPLYIKNSNCYIKADNIPSGATIIISGGNNNNGIPYTELTSSTMEKQLAITDTTKPITYLIFRVASGTTIDTVIHLELIEGSTYKHTSENPIEYCKIGTYEDKFIRTSGKNLFNINANRTNNNTTNSVNGNVLTVTSTSSWASMDYLNISLPNNTYTLSFDWKSSTSLSGTDARIYVYDNPTATGSLGAISPTGTSGHLTLTFTNTNNAITIRFSPNNSGTVKTTSIDFSNIQINEGSTDLPYEPYGSNEWYIKKNIGKVVLDGTEDWYVSNTGTANYQLYCWVSANLGGNNVGYSNYYPVIFITGTNTNQGIVGVGHYIRLRYGEEPTIADLKTWLTSHNVILYQPLTSPTYTQITGTLAEQLENVYQKMLSQEGQTNISQVNNDLSFNMVVSAIEK